MRARGRGRRLCDDKADKPLGTKHESEIRQRIEKQIEFAAAGSHEPLMA